MVIDCRFALADPNQVGDGNTSRAMCRAAVYFDLNQDLSSPVQAHGGRHPLPHWDNFIAKLEAAGVSSGNGTPPTRVIAYDNSRFAFAARLWWLLKYLGHDGVAVFRWGLRGLAAGRLPRQLSHPPTPSPVTFARLLKQLGS